MYKQLVRQNLIIIAAGLLVFFFLSVAVTNFVNRRNLQSELVYLSDILANHIMATDTDDELRSAVNEFTEGQKWFAVVIATSLGDIVVDSGVDAVGDGVLRRLEDFEMEKVGLPGNAGTVYVNGSRIYYICALTEDMILRTSITLADNTNFILLGMFILVAVLIVLLVVSITLTGKASARITQAFDNIGSHLRLTAKGRYEEIEEDHRYEEVAQAYHAINAVNNSIYQYITQISAERDKLNYIIENINEGLILSGVSGRIYAVNDRACEIFGARRPAGEAYLRDIISDGEFLRRLQEETDTRAEMRFDYHSAAQDKIYLATLNCFSRSPDDGEEDMVSVVLYDITALRKEERIKADFIANASHELKTPITSISGFSELLLSGLVTKPEDVKKYVTNICEEAAVMRHTVEELLYLSKLDYSDELTEKEEVDLYALASVCIGNHAAAAERAGVVMEQRGKKAAISGSEALLEHMLGNLIDNAIKYNKPGGRVTVETGTAKGKKFVRVRDTGLGIKPQHLDKLFERFYRVENSRSRDTGGTGLGLTIVNKICALHHAQIEVKSRYGRGTSFTVTFAPPASAAGVPAGNKNQTKQEAEAAKCSKNNP